MGPMPTPTGDPPYDSPCPGYPAHKTIIMKINFKGRATAAQADREVLETILFSEFAEQADKAGFVKFTINLAPKNGGTPNLKFTNNKGESLLVNISKGLAAQMKGGEVKKNDLFACQIVDGKNAKDEARYYLLPKEAETFETAAIVTYAKKVEKAAPVTLEEMEDAFS